MLLPNVTKVVYIDPDTIVQGDVGELWEVALPPGSKYAPPTGALALTGNWLQRSTHRVHNRG